MTTPTIPNGEEHFFTTRYSGNGTAQRVGKFVPFTDSGTIANSVMFNDADDAYLARTFSTPTNNKKWTYSVWFKRCTLGTNQALMSADYDGATYWDMRFNTSDQIYIQNRIGSSNILSVNTTRTFKDTSKWYHLLFVYDSDNSTSTSRAILYIDGDVQTLSGYPSSGDASAYNVNSEPHHIGVSRTADASGAIWSEFDGYFAEANFVDGQALLPASFGETDTSTGRWIPSTVKPYPTTTTDIAVTVVSSGGNKYALDGVTQGTVTLIEGATYKFDQSDSSNSGHPLRFSTTSDGTHGGGSEFTSGVTTAGTPGSSGAYTEITVPTGTATLYYYCTNHSGMGGTANTQNQYGTNGFRLKFQDSSAFGDDTSGNGNDFTSSSLTASDQRTDSPTNNMPTMRPYNPSYSQAFAEGNMQHATTGFNVGYPVVSTLRPKGSGKFYAECRASEASGGYNLTFGCFAQEDLHNYSSGAIYPGNANWGSGLWVEPNQYVRWNGVTSYTNYTPFTFDAGDVIGLALDLDIGLLSFYDDDNALIGSITWDREKSACFTAMSNKAVTFIWNFGDNPTFNGTETAGGNTDGDGNGNFLKSVPTGFKVLKQDNMAETSKGVPGLTWTKDRDAAVSWMCIDSSRVYTAEGVPGAMNLNNTNREYGQIDFVDGINKFLKGGYTVMTSNSGASYMNSAGSNYVSFSWVANSGTKVTNTTGSITSTVQANTTAGFSIVQYVGTGSSGSVGHGLTAAPSWMIFKDRDTDSTNWRVYHKSLGGITKYQILNTNGATQTASMWGAPTASAFIIGGTGYEVNESGRNYVAYCWHEVEGYSKFGSYMGTGLEDGPFIYTGFKPSWIMHKANNAASWYAYDVRRSPINPVLLPVYPDGTYVETPNVYGFDLLSNGFKVRQPSGYGGNYSGVETYYMAFAEHPFVGDGTSPTTAR